MPTLGGMIIQAPLKVPDRARRGAGDAVAGRAWLAARPPLSR
jgi:hypothetical protein